MTPEEYEEKIARLQSDVDDLDREVDSLTGTIVTLEDRVAELEDENETLEDRVSELEDEIEQAEKNSEAALRAIDALRIYLSWVDSPPPEMDSAQHARFASGFRRDLDNALRKVA
jgi:chromosome segregation ATPase